MKLMVHYYLQKSTIQFVKNQGSLPFEFDRFDASRVRTV